MYMVSAGQVSAHLEEITTDLTNYNSSVESLSSSWQGQSYDGLKQKASMFVEEYQPVVNQQMNSFIEAINLYQEYETAKTNLSISQNNYNQAVSNKDSSAMYRYSSDVETYKNKINQLKSEIESCLASISTVLEGAATSSASITTTASGEISYQTTRFANTTVWYAVIPKEKMPKLAVANDNYSKMTSEKPSEIAKRNGATLGINCCITGSGQGMLYTNGQLVSNSWTSGEGQTLYMTQDGTLNVVTNNKTSIQGVLNQNPVWATQGFYTIIRDGKYDEWNTDLAKSRHPRTFIGQDYDGNYIVGVCTGRQSNEAGMTFKDVYDFVTTEVSDNIRILYNADGGGSSAFIYNGEKLNPNTDSNERPRPDLIYWE